MDHEIRVAISTFLMSLGPIVKIGWTENLPKNLVLVGLTRMVVVMATHEQTHD
jgi:hypothetical protein